MVKAEINRMKVNMSKYKTTQTLNPITFIIDREFSSSILEDQVIFGKALGYS
jgi:hypothetical protein